MGLSYAKALAFGLGKPLVGVNHIEGHLSANYIEHKDLKPPFITLIVSGGHTHLVEVNGYGKYEILGKTKDDASGEAFDKVAKALGLGSVGLIKCGGGDPIAAAQEQWNDGSNTLCVSPGKICVYQRNSVTNDVLYKEGLDLLVMPSAELSRGRGGPRCMSMPFAREDL